MVPIVLVTDTAASSSTTTLTTINHQEKILKHISSLSLSEWRENIEQGGYIWDKRNFASEGSYSSGYKKTQGQEGQLEEGVKEEKATNLVCTGVTGPDTLLWAEAHQREGARHSSKKTDGQTYAPDRLGSREAELWLNGHDIANGSQHPGQNPVFLFSVENNLH